MQTSAYASLTTDTFWISFRSRLPARSFPAGLACYAVRKMRTSLSNEGLRVLFKYLWICDPAASNDADDWLLFAIRRQACAIKAAIECGFFGQEENTQLRAANAFRDGRGKDALILFGRSSVCQRGLYHAYLISGRFEVLAGRVECSVAFT
jgi:hypothetical protein